MRRGILRIFDKLENKIRSSLSHRPILYAFIAGIGASLFFRGIWMIADSLPFMTGFVSLVLSVIIMLLTGAFVSYFVSDQVIVSGLRKEKNLVEKTEAEILKEADKLGDIKKELDEVKKDIEGTQARRKRIKKTPTQ